MDSGDKFSSINRLDNLKIMKTVDLKKATLEELKALAYDVLVELEKNQKTLQLVQAEVQLRAKEE